MEGLERKTSSDWYDIREASKSFDALDDYFKIPKEQLRIQIDKLEFAVEQGVVEYKKASLGPLFAMLEGSRYRSPALEEVRRQLAYTEALLFAVLVQRQLADGTLKIAQEKREGAAIAPESLDLTAVLRDVNERIRQTPEYANHPFVKNILLQVSQLQRERANMQKLLPTIKPEARETFQRNFRKVFSGLVDKIKRNYAALLQEEMPEAEGPKPVLAAVALAPLVPILTDQAECLSRLRSGLAFASEEKYGTRELFARLARERGEIERLLQRESHAYARLQTQIDEKAIAGEHSIARAFCAEIIRVLQRAMGHRS